MKRSATSSFHNVLTCSGEVIEYSKKKFIEISFKSIIKFIREFGCALDIVEKPLMNSI